MAVRSSYRALIVDDDELVRQLITRQLSQEGITCFEASDGVVASNALRARRFDLIVADLIMPRMHGHQLVREILTAADAPVVVVVTGVTDPKLTRDMLRRGVADIFYKPLAIDLFSAKIRTLLDRRAVLDEAASHGKPLPEQLARTADILRVQLEEIEASFRTTIEKMEVQKTDLEKGLVSSVRVLSKVIKLIGKFEGSHAVRVEKLAVGLAEKAGLDADERRNIGIAALLHDIGQFGMPDAIRNRPPWNLRGEELQMYKTYSTIGALLVSEISSMDDVTRYIEQHTERYDGAGFPSGLMDEEIALGARILAIADGYDTFTTHKPDEDAKQFLAEQKGRSYDPELVETFIHNVVPAPLDGGRIVSMLVHGLTPGMVLAESVYDARGTLLVTAQTELNENALNRLKRLAPEQKVNVYAVMAPV